MLFTLWICLSLVHQLKFSRLPFALDKTPNCKLLEVSIYPKSILSCSAPLVQWFTQLCRCLSQWNSFTAHGTSLFPCQLIFTLDCILLSVYVTEFKSFAAWDVLFKKEIWLSLGSFIYLQQGEEARDSHPKLCLYEERLSHCMYTPFGSLHVDFFFPVG